MDINSPDFEDFISAIKEGDFTNYNSPDITSVIEKKNTEYAEKYRAEKFNTRMTIATLILTTVGATASIIAAIAAILALLK